MINKSKNNKELVYFNANYFRKLYSEGRLIELPFKFNDFVVNVNNQDIKGIVDSISVKSDYIVIWVKSIGNQAFNLQAFSPDELRLMSGTEIEEFLNQLNNGD